MSRLAVHLTYSDIAVLGLSLLGFSSYYTNGTFWNKPNPLEYKFYERPQLLGLPGASETSATFDRRNIAFQLEQLKADGVIFWASQSGRAESYAYRLEKDLSQRFGVKSVVADLSDYDHDALQHVPSSKFVIFVVSTYGEGDPPDNGWSFWDWLKPETKSTPLQHLHFAAFGLGNSNYRYYNKVVDFIADGLVARGATMLLPTGKADDAKGQSEEDFLRWKEDFFPIIKEFYKLEERLVQYEPTLCVLEQTHLNNSVLQEHKPHPMIRSDPKASLMAGARVSEIRLATTAQSSKPCLHVEVDLSDHPQLKYKTGDHLVLWPTNPQDEVSRILRILDRWSQRDQIISVSTLNPDRPQLHHPTPTTLRRLFEHHLEICAPVSREVVLSLRTFTSSDLVNKMLSNIATTKERYTAFVNSRHVTFARLLEYTQQIDPSVNWDNLPLSFVFECLSSISPRYYSISSSSSVSPRRVAITVSLSSTALPTMPIVTVPGLVSSYLSSLSMINSIPLPTLTIQLRRSDFKLPSSPSTPLILIAAGSGIAPFRAFLHERARLADIGHDSGRIIFFYGCRHPDQDYLYRQEIEDLVHGSLAGKLQVILAHSRYGHMKVYVQDCIAEHSADVAKMLTEDSANLYICGSTVMARNAGDQVVKAAERHSSFEGKTGDEWRSELKRFRRWQEDVWG